MRKRIAAITTAAATVVGLGLAASPAQAVDRYNFSINIADGLCLDILHSSPSTGATVQQWWCNGTDAQQWNVLDAGSHYFKIQSASWPQYCLNNWNGGGAAGGPVKLYNCDSTDDLFNTVGADPSNYEQFQPKAASSTCENMSGGQDLGNIMRLAPCSDTGPHAQFRLYRPTGI
ncbi:RICIN domain-containing protein [Streptomyces sp. NPDC055966]|uniref:RICIN domain-containing protein n=1 Tax=unclassified Streptomyces TaxID=2593676 RepID=UPI0035D6E795